MDGIQALQWEEEAAECIMNIRNDGPEKEAGIRNFFRVWLKGRYPRAVITSEDQRGKRFIDLLVSQDSMGQKILEFKGWWNNKKNNTPEQLCGYLTDAHTEGYIIMINPNKTKSIVEEYKLLIKSKEMKFADGSWLEHKVPGTQLSYFESQHQFGIHTKKIFHFIINVYF